VKWTFIMNSWYRHLVIWMKINLSMKKVLLFLLAFLCFHQLDAQQIIKGKVKDDTNLPLPGVSIQVKNTLRGTFTEVDGSFSISAGENDTLIFSMVGMVSQRVAVGNRTVLDSSCLLRPLSWMR
jgi:hypothetical protein